MQKNQHFVRDFSNLYIFNTLSNRLYRLECHKVPRLPRKTTWQPAWTHSIRRGFPASPIDTATLQENQRLETNHVGAPKRAFRARRPPIFTLWNMPKRHVLQLPPQTRSHHKFQQTLDSLDLRSIAQTWGVFLQNQTNPYRLVPHSKLSWFMVYRWYMMIYL